MTASRARVIDVTLTALVALLSLAALIWWLRLAPV